MPDSNPANANSLAIDLRDVSLSFGDVRVLQGATLALPRGRRAALVGRSGAGKTSLLAIVAGLLKPTGGGVFALGEDLTAMDEDELANLRRQHIGVVFQHFHLLETLTAAENVSLPLELAGRGDAAAVAADMLRRVGLEDRATHFPAQLSGGEKQRVAIARAFALRPALALADEPTGNLDDATGEAVLETLFELAQEANSAILFVTHNSAILPRFDDVWKMQNGKLTPA